MKLLPLACKAGQHMPPMSKHTVRMQSLVPISRASATLVFNRTSSFLFYDFHMFSLLPRTLFCSYSLHGCHVKSIGQSPCLFSRSAFCFLQGSYHNCLTHFSGQLGCSFAPSGVSSMRAAPRPCLECIFLAQRLIRGSISGQ